MTRFWKEKISYYGLDETMEEFEILDHFQLEFSKKKENSKHSILLYETKDLRLKILYKGNTPDFIRECLDEFILNYCD
jgi:hypothetical protein